MKIKTYLINLDGSQERLLNSTEQLNSVDWVFERYSAYDGRGRDVNEFENYCDQKTRDILGRSMLNSELGCYLSHYGCVEKFLETDADYLVVLEDDLKISVDFKCVMYEIFDFLSKNADIEWYLLNIASKKKKFTKELARLGDYSLEKSYYFPIRGLGLVWSRKGAKEFLLLAKNAQLPVDIFFQNWLTSNGKGLIVWPPLVRPAGLDSDILGTVAAQGINRKEKESREKSFFLKKQIRVLRNNFIAARNFMCKK